jgi:hypothetical protein
VEHQKIAQYLDVTGDTDRCCRLPALQIGACCLSQNLAGRARFSTKAETRDFRSAPSVGPRSTPARRGERWISGKECEKRLGAPSERPQRVVPLYTGASRSWGGWGAGPPQLMTALASRMPPQQGSKAGAG